MTANSEQTWEHVRLLTARPPDTEDVYGTVEVDGRRYWECGHSGWHMLIAWLAGQHTLARYPEDRPQYWRHTNNYGRPGVVSKELETAELKEIANDSVNDYLIDAGLPKRPSGYRWFQVLPPNVDASELTASINEAILRSRIKRSTPSVVIPIIEPVIKRAYDAER